MESNTTWDIKCINSYIMPRLISVLVNWKIYFCYRIINIISAQSNSDTALPTHSATMMKLETCREFQSIISITQYFLDLASKSNDYDNYTELSWRFEPKMFHSYCCQVPTKKLYMGVMVGGVLEKYSYYILMK